MDAKATKLGIGDGGEFLDGVFGHVEEPLHCLAALVEAEHVLEIKELAGHLIGEPYSTISWSLCGEYLAVPIISPRSFTGKASTAFLPHQW